MSAMGRYRLAIGVAWALLGIGALGCSARRPDVSQPLPRIVLERVAKGGPWRATYELGRPVKQLCFQRPAAFYRESVWSIVTPGWDLDRNGEWQVLTASEGQAASRVVVEFPVYTEIIRGVYELFSSFTDGSVAIYSGHLYAAPSDDRCPANDHTSDFVRRLELQPPQGQHVVVHGRVSEEKFLWDTPYPNGSYVYFGNIEPLETEAMIAIVDPGAPAWLGERFREVLPRLFASYTERFGEALPWKPSVLLSFRRSDRPGYSHGGGALPGQVQLHAEGQGWNSPTSETAVGLLHLLAHEAAHLWNGQLHPYAEPADSWMHEGSADAFARAMLYEIGAIDDDTLAQQRTLALNRCAWALREGELVGSRDRGRYGNYYACGEIVALGSAAAIHSGASTADGLFELWRGMFARSTADGLPYSREHYLAAWRELGATPAQVDLLTQLVDTAHSDPASVLSGFLEAVGLPIATAQRHPAQLRRDLGYASLAHLMAVACGSGRFGFQHRGSHVLTDVLPDCSPFDRPLSVVTVAGYRLTTDGDRALSATVSHCSSGEAVTLGLEGGVGVEVPCGEPPAAPPQAMVFPPAR